MTRNEFYVAVGANIRKARRTRKRAQKELAAHLKLSRESISNIEKGRHAVQLHVLVEAARYLEVEVIDLLPGDALGAIKASVSARDRFAARVMRGQS